ncbi:uncharacterized protein B0H18DRAFT_831699, partial [Fomitopsis serialis]|uniref:uncharacterized protein n=1 Tax=Fomitopsis serialis TaxID=139415 RepID=UPI0020089CE8
PVVVVDAQHKLQGYWSPSEFIEKHGAQKVTLTDCEAPSPSPREVSSTVSDFFQSLVEGRKGGNVWKLKDWPPSAKFSAEFPMLDEALRAGLPFNDFCAIHGVFNLASHYPLNGNAPDLGPKMFVAHASAANGSTRLHLDLADAVNLMTWAAMDADGAEGGAVWHIWHASHLPQLRQFLLSDQVIKHDPTLGDPVHSAQHYLDASAIERFRARYGLLPYTIFQRRGEAVFIPAGSAHQVSNRTDAMKVANDFISIGNLCKTRNLVKEFRDYRLAASGTDVLQLNTTIFYAW